MVNFSHVADLDEIRSNDFNLNISRYVDKAEHEEVPSVEEALAQLREAEQRRDEAASRRWFPRTRGDRPGSSSPSTVEAEVPPHTRG